MTNYVSPWFDEWAWQLPTSPVDWRTRRYRGLPAVLTSDEFESAVQDFVEKVYRAALALKPSASIVLEKSAGRDLRVETILRVVPGARFIHILRDGRDVAASLRQAASGWGLGGRLPVFGTRLKVGGVRSKLRGLRAGRLVATWRFAMKS